MFMDDFVLVSVGAAIFHFFCLVSASISDVLIVNKDRRSIKVYFGHLQTAFLICAPSLVQGVRGCQCAGPVCHQVHVKRDVKSAFISPEVTAVRHGGGGRAELPHTVRAIYYVIMLCLWS